MIVTKKSDFGTVAAQYGQGYEFKYLQFKTEDACEKYVNFLVENRADCLMGMMIGFILDAPINMVGDSGWSVIEKQLKGCE